LALCRSRLGFYIRILLSLVGNSMTTEGHQEHPLSVYLWIWGLLFVLSFFSYMVDWFAFQGLLRWGLILFFMFLNDKRIYYI